jgi:hypothetical protein
VSGFTFKCRKFNTQVTTEDGTEYVIETFFGPDLEEAIWILNQIKFPTLEAALEYIRQEKSGTITTSG